jgi:hypothetical protein
MIPEEPEPGKRTTQEPTERGETLPESQDAPRVCDGVAGKVHEAVNEMCAGEPADKKRTDEAPHLAVVEPLARRPAVQQFASADHREGDQYTECVQPEWTQLQRRLREEADHVRTFWRRRRRISNAVSGFTLRALSRVSSLSATTENLHPPGGPGDPPRPA